MPMTVSTTHLQNTKSVTIVCFQFDNLRDNFEGEFTEEALNAFVVSNRLPLVIEFTDEVSSSCLITCNSLTIETLLCLIFDHPTNVFSETPDLTPVEMIMQ